ncbi:unnamed protein product [Symbiodinium sp. KB8]|nr:unnamed protein product [Symbiodinium sp. KB8]
MRQVELQRELAELQTTEAARPAFVTIRDGLKILGLFDDDKIGHGRGQDRQAAELESLHSKSLEMEVHLLLQESDWPPRKVCVPLAALGVNALAGDAQD